MPPHPLTNLEIQKYYHNEPRLMVFILEIIYLKRSLMKKIKDWADVINLDEYSDIRIHWIALYVLNNKVTYFDSFGVKHIPKEVKKVYW